ncbi:zinc finger SWIM domain-containing protein [Gloeocapsa sp. PCC 7428]|uniref:SWIM zinc finger family protein n=1 Tax=Gloeocapsa sp. PCC 7428 TaxID=1173026 RepID=UPI0002A5E96A|nr:SWIM zinc finger family protein [Gloeocapsa sp. PCC 7428]AFZ30760.1 zinc finger SWIM domain-containing protein [Gloeocapsa sp. PCC 7428]
MTNFSFQASREWWSQRWLDLLDSYRFKKRLERARNYARQGNILGIQFEGAKVSARVQGTEPEPYQVSLFLEPFTDEQWSYVIETMSQRAIFAAKLLAGEMPPNIEEVFTANGLSLFPFTLSEVRSKCSCPDKANPCKHIGAVYYQLGDRFSEDPFVLFQLRGRTKNQIIDALRELRSAHQEEVVSTEPETTSSTLDNAPSVTSTSFWHYQEPLDPNLVVIAPSTSSDVLEMLGAIPLSHDLADDSDANSSEILMNYLDTTYKQVAQQAFIAAMNTAAN